MLEGGKQRAVGGQDQGEAQLAPGAPDDAIVPRSLTLEQFAAERALTTTGDVDSHIDAGLAVSQIVIPGAEDQTPRDRRLRADNICGAPSSNRLVDADASGEGGH